MDRKQFSDAIINGLFPNIEVIHFAAAPYLDAMMSMDNIKDNYGHDDGRSIVLYFLSNASSWRGDDAKRLKAELKLMLK